MSEPILIAGAGIGGLCLALSLARSGRKSIVLERASAIREVGAGLQLSPNATHLLAELGVLDAAIEKAYIPKTIRIRSARDGSLIARIPMGDTIEARHHAPYFVIHRADLQKVLLDEALATGLIDIHLNTSLSDAVIANDVVTVTADNLGNTQTFTSPALIGADGIHSVTRQKIMNGSAPIFTGRTAYRATIPIDTVPEELREDTGLWLGHNAHLVHYPVSSATELNIVAIVKEGWTSDSWSTPDIGLSLIQRFSDWPPMVRTLLESPIQWLKWALYDLAPDQTWSKDRVALLGDSVHAMLPFMAQGASMAIEDAVVLCHLLRQTDDQNIPATLKKYEKLRKARASRTQKTATKNGKIYHMGFPLSLARDTVMRLHSPESLLARFDWIYGWKPDTKA